MRIPLSCIGKCESLGQPAFPNCSLLPEAHRGTRAGAGPHQVWGKAIDDTLRQQAAPPPPPPPATPPAIPVSKSGVLACTSAFALHPIRIRTEYCTDPILRLYRTKWQWENEEGELERYNQVGVGSR